MILFDNFKYFLSPIQYLIILKSSFCVLLYIVLDIPHFMSPLLFFLILHRLIHRAILSCDDWDCIKRKNVLPPRYFISTQNISSFIDLATNLCRYSFYQTIIRHIFCHHSARGHHSVCPNSISTYYRSIHSLINVFRYSSFPLEFHVQNKSC